MPLQFTDAEINAKAVQLGVITEGAAVPNRHRSKVVAALVEERRAADRQEKQAEPVCAKEIVVEPGGAVLIDGEPFPWLIARQPMEIGLNPEGISTVRLTLLAEAVQVLKPKPSKNESE
ncbi:hypothetical protein [Streptomyces stelliscabiei]|uniref:Uncharacterized protein n=1 Tax=Streptomyces stelliscabiei TaxID=146820 RepID=A0A8I0TU58_9ACTN|nr:hypothetical protein [Streptomyces stelliscabiei]KND30082.1 hypothetical protein IQ64_41420 [Streptomyces stelliscabiei]MBE1599691.1 hypothetical protein [Streptomyces stelliscabiei]MDX2519353.1 hypothetical protein [Streptomyces stelliscabiei]MDX2549717.1 hypothetical protein [Streptomyces stelliscabiei]MDX2616148.1 hypothetical protein [Streptomyces stelliscabiei]